MTEAPSPVFYASAKPEQMASPKPEKSKAVSGVRKALDKWLERIGPKSVENHFVKAHENVLATLNSDQRKEVFAKEAEKWQKSGKKWGVTATAFDATLIGLGAGLSFIGLRNPQIGANIYISCVDELSRLYNEDKTKHSPVNNLLMDLLSKPIDPSITEKTTLFPEATSFIGRSIAIEPAIAALGALIFSGPGHLLAHLAAGSAEQVGKMKARTNNYVDSGKAAEHATKVSNVIGKAATETAKYVAEHPDEIRKTVETVNRVKRQNAESAQKLKETQQKAAEVKLEADYQDWIAHHPDKVYYEQSGQPMPSKADYVEIKAREEAAKQAAREEEKRGEAK